jgi:asparagine synthase (glutamine-hydrolysing)
MTGLAGLWRFDGRPDAAEGCGRMLTAQEVYGPHHGAHWSDTNVALGRRLMRVLPEDSFDRQPLIGGEGRYVLVADVRLDNRDELAEALQIPATRARTLCDAAILLAAVERWDESCLERLVGDYAFAVWDGARRRLLLARDPLGQRPLHYHRGNNFFAFASMPKGLHALSDIPYAPNEERIAEFLVMMPETGPQTYFLGIQRVEPGHVVTVTPTGFVTRGHWQWNRRRIALPRPKDYKEALRDLLDRAVSCRLRGTGDVGAYLSGGLDSGGVVATAARLLAPSGRRVIAFTGVPRDGYDGPALPNAIIDERLNAAATAALYPNVEHILVHNEGRSPLADLDRLFFLLDRPFSGICASGWIYSLDKAIEDRSLRFILGGSRGNLGLSYDGMELLPELFRNGRWLRLWSEASALVAARHMRWRGILANTLGPWCPRALWVWIHKIAKGRALDIADYTAINPRRLHELDLPGRAKSNYDVAFRPFKDGLALRLHLLQFGDPGNYNKASVSGRQIDFRDPTADVRLLDFCFAAPMEQFLRDGLPRALARSALADRLPKQVLEPTNRPVLQMADWHEDLAAARDDVVDELDRLEACPAAAAALNLPQLRRMTENWPSGGWERDEVRVPYRYTLLRAIAVGHFLLRATRGNR